MIVVVVMVTGGRFAFGKRVLLGNERCWFLRIRLELMWYLLYF